MTVTIRDATIADAPFYARLFPELGVDEPPPTEPLVAGLVPKMRIAELDGVPAAFAIAVLEGEEGFLRQLVVDPPAQRRGVGHALCVDIARRFAELGARRWRLNVKEDNLAAIGLYARFGLAIEHRSVAMWMTHAAREALPLDATLAPFAPDEEDDGPLEKRFSLPPGRLAFLRGEPDAPVAVCDLDGREVGLMRFAPSHPGANLFCASSPAAARVLLDEIARAVPDVPRYGVVVASDESLVQVLLEAGATLRFRMIQMEGATLVDGG